MERWMLVGLGGASVAAAVASLHCWAALMAIPALVLAARSGVKPSGETARRTWRRIGGAASGGLVLLPLLVTFQSIYLETAIRIAGPAAVVLSLLMVPLSLFAREMLIPCSISLLAASALDRGSLPLYGLIVVAALFTCLHLASYRAIRLLPLLVFIVFAGGIAEGVVRFLPWAQPWVEGKAGDLLTPARTARAGLSLTSRLGEIEELGLSPEVALRVWSDRPQYLRARVYRAFNGRVWSRGAEVERRPMTPAPPVDADLARWLEAIPGTTWAAPAAAGPRVRSRILLERRPPAGALLAPGGVEFARLNEGPAWIDAAGVLEPWGASPDLYAVVNRPSLPAPAPDPDCLDASAEVDVRMKELAARLEKDADPAERVRRTLAYLESTCTYSLRVGQFVSTDPVAEFVFDKRKGYCEYFASAAALLLRMEGVPARYVVGYSVRPDNFEGGHYVVREADAHAWVEAWLEGRGWVELDPTPAAQFESMRKPLRGGAVSGLWERLKAWVALLRVGDLMTTLRQLALPVLIGAAVVAVALLLHRSRGRWKRGGRGPRGAARDSDGLPPELRELFVRLDRHWRRSGHPRPPSRAPLEHLLSLPESARSGRDVVDAVYRFRYGGQAPSADEMSVLRRANVLNQGGAG